MADKKWDKDYSKPVKKYQLNYQIYSQSVEEIYFWFIGWFKDNLRHAVKDVEKITDVYSASESSAFFGAQSARAGLLQDRIANNLRTLSEMTKALFQIVRELSIIDMRLDLYNKSMDKSSEDFDSSEITLKGLYVDLVEGGGQNASSVYGLAQKVGFTILPDLFFRIRVDMDHKTGKLTGTVDGVVGKLDFSEKIKEVLARKLQQFYTWKEHTFKELTTRRGFQLNYLKQYYNSMKLYIAWVKPYLKYVKRLGMDTSRLDTPELIAGMEQAMMEMEILVKLKTEGNYTGYINLNFLYRTAPEMSYSTKDYQHRGPIHVGKTEIAFSAFSWTEEDYEAYKKDKAKEDLELLGTIDVSLQEAMDSVGDQLKQYLDELEGLKPKEKKKTVKLKGINKYLARFLGESEEVEVESAKEEKPKAPSLLDPFFSIFRGLADILDSFTGLRSKIGKPAGEKVDTWRAGKEQRSAKENARKILWSSYNIFKKAHGMITW